MASTTFPSLPLSSPTSSHMRWPTRRGRACSASCTVTSTKRPNTSTPRTHPLWTAARVASSASTQHTGLGVLGWGGKGGGCDRGCWMGSRGSSSQIQLEGWIQVYVSGECVENGSKRAWTTDSTNCHKLLYAQFNKVCGQAVFLEETGAAFSQQHLPWELGTDWPF